MPISKPQISVIILDDQEDSVRSLEQLLDSDKRITVKGTFTDPKAALQEIIIKKPDLLILDIQMPGIDGFDLVKQLHEVNIRPYIIFITAFDEYAIQAIKLSAFDFLLKPVDPAELNLTIERFIFDFFQKSLEKNYLELVNHLSIKKIKFNTAGGFIMINPQDIVFVKADWNYSEIFFDNNRHELVVMNLGMIEKLLPQGNFARINRSVIINIQFLEKVNRGKRLCVLKKGDDIFSFSIPLRRIRELESMF
jgi:two-component system, LytTR family, response regulator